MAAQRHDERDVRLDVFVAVAAAVFLVVTSPLAAAEGAELAAVSYPLCAVAGLAFALRRRHPLATAAIVVACSLAYILVNRDGGPIFAAALAALTLLGAARPGGWLLPAVAATVALSVASLVAVGPEVHIPLVALLLLAGPRIAADRARTRMLAAAAIRQEASRQVVEERLRIAREVHDIVGHGLATIALRAGVADHVAQKDPREALEALQAIRGIARDSLNELGALLGVLRAQADRAPVPDLAQLPRLVEGLREAGMDVELDVEGVDDPLPEVVGAAGYRIVQEALTNVARHAGGGAHARVRLVRGRRHVVVEVVDDGADAPAEVRDGGGMTGMRERAAALGGTFEARAARGGGFRVRATLPAAPR